MVVPLASMPIVGSSKPTARGSSVKVLFVLLHAGFIRYYEPVIRALVARGHRVHIAYEDTREKLGDQQNLRQLMDECPRITSDPLPHRFENVRHILLRSDASAERSGRFEQRPSTSNAATVDEHGKLLWAGGKLPDAFNQAWEGVATAVRLMQDYLRYFDPCFNQSPRLRARAEKRVPQLLRKIITVPAQSGQLARGVLGSVLRSMERVIPTPTSVNTYLEHQSPDVLFVTPLVDFGSQQVDYIKTARRLGIPSIHGVASWDNLTTKGLARVHADRVLVWNERQKGEATSLHGVPGERVIVTGAQTFDEWFTRRPSQTREEFYRAVGLPPNRKYLLYLGSSSFIAPNEIDFVERWIKAIRSASNSAVSSCGILIRPHPANARQFRALDLEQWSDVSVWPPIGFEPGDKDFKQDYFDSLFYSGAVVGINTSALIEAAIVGRITCTVRDPDFVHAQGGAVHFSYLAREDEGCLVVADDLDTHIRQLAPVLSGETKAEMTPFIESFVRPRGVSTAVTPYIVETVENIAAKGSRRHTEAVTTPVVRVLLYPVALTIRALASGRTVTFITIRPIISVVIFVAALWYRGAEVLRMARWRCRKAGETVRKTLKRLLKGIRREPKLLRKRALLVRKKFRISRAAVRRRVHNLGLPIRRTVRAVRAVRADVRKTLNRSLKGTRRELLRLPKQMMRVRKRLKVRNRLRKALHSCRVAVKHLVFNLAGLATNKKFHND